MNRLFFSLVTASILLTAPAMAEFVEERVRYSYQETAFEGVLIYDRSIDGPAPGVFMVPNWMGVTSNAIEKAKKLAGDEYVFFVADLYGAEVRPDNSSEAGAAAGEVRGDRSLMRGRAEAALEAFREVEAPLDSDRMAAIGFCFGGGAVLELGRAGAELDAIVSFHGDLLSPTLESDAGETEAKVLVLHGADDPHVPQSDVQEFIDVMRSTDVDWQLVQFGNSVHSFTNPSADTPGKADYNALTAERAFAYMELLFAEVWD